MGHTVEVLLPGPWWHSLTYLTQEPCAPGLRVQVPMGKGHRVGLTVSHQEGAKTSLPRDLELRPIERLLDPVPALGAGFLKAAFWTADAFLCSRGDLLRSLVPSSFWKGAAFPPWEESLGPGFSTSFCYGYHDGPRLERYRTELLGCTGGALCLFPEREQAVSFHKTLRGLIPKERLFLWPLGGEAVAKAWKQVLQVPEAVVIGGPSAVAAPLTLPQLFLIDDESNPAWWSRVSPSFSLRSFLAARAKASGAELLLGGRLPSSRIFHSLGPQDPGLPEANFRFVKIFDAPKALVQGVKSPLPLSKPLMEATLAQVNQGRPVLWVLDRRGFTDELRCGDCGALIHCSRCGGSMRLEMQTLHCRSCGHRSKVPLECPVCGGLVLEGRQPGLEALVPMVKPLVQDRPLFLWHQDDPAKVSEARRRIEILKSQGGLVLGSRRCLSLLDQLEPTLVCWLDGDAESRRCDYSARFQAYSMMLESWGRGQGAREVIVQSRRPLQGWQRGLRQGWKVFWDQELEDRRDLGFPPFSYLVEIQSPPGVDHLNLGLALEERGLEVLEPDPQGRKLWILAQHLGPLRRALEPFFSIANSRKGFPQVQVHID